MMDHWEILDLYKALLSLAAGLVLGLERELKDKSAGLKTITVISLGATLFSIISYKVGGPGNSTHIAAYIVSGVGFLGAGVIFKDQLSVSGLTTAGIIWLAAAIGTAIGFGEFYLAATFLGAALVTILITPFINKLFRFKKENRKLNFVIDKTNLSQKEKIYQEINRMGIRIEEKRIALKEGKVEISADLVLPNEKIASLQDYLLANSYISDFSF